MSKRGSAAIRRQLTIFAMIGTLNDEKGVPFAIEAFRSVKSPDARLLLVGYKPPGMQARLEQLAAGDPRIVFWGEEREIEQIYTLADYNLRGESYPCVGSNDLRGAVRRLWRARSG